MAATLDLMAIVFDQILKIDPMVMAKYPLVEDKLIYLLLIPHAILLLFLFTFAIWIATPMFAEKKGIRNLFALVGYIFVVYSGWYGKYLIPFFVNYFAITIAISVGFFLLTRILPMIYVPGLVKFGSEAGKMAGKAIVGKGKEEKALKQQIHVLDDFIRTNEHNASDRVQQLVAEARLEKRKLEETLKHL